MRNFVITSVVLVMMASQARAEDVAGSYDVKFEEMGHNCNPPPVALGRSKLTIATRGGSLTVNVETIPEMAGVQKGGKISAKTSAKGPLPTTVQGLDARYSVAGKLDDTSGVLQLVLVAEYVKHDDKKPYCTQSWNVTGAKGTPEEKPAKDKPAKPDKKK